MNTKTILLETKLKDLEKYSATMPINAKIVSKGFAKAIGSSSGKVLLAYDSMLTNISNTEPKSKTISECSKILDKESKVKFMNFNARLCSIVALNYSGFMNVETELYTQLMNDLKGKEITLNNINYELKSTASSDSEKYTKLLEQKSQAIYDFGVLMGTTKDTERFKNITQNMPGTLKTYFTNVVKLHTGNKLFSWPIPFRKYTGIISDILYNDSTSYALQDSINKDLGFKNPELNENRYDILQQEINKVLTEKKFKNKWQAAKVLPAAAFYMSGLEVYAHEITTNVHNHDHNYLSAATTAGILASTTAGDEKDDRSDFITTFLTLFTTTL